MTETLSSNPSMARKVTMLAVIRPIPAAMSSLPRVSIAMRSEAIASPPTLDRRGGPRRSEHEPVVDRFTASTHHPLPLWFALGYAGHWALMTGVSISPHGVLLRALDPTEAPLELPQRDVMGAWRRLGARVGIAASPLWFSTACVGARDLVATLAERAHVGGCSSEITVDLMPLDLRSGLRDVHIVGVLAPLADPAPHILGVVVDDLARRHLEAIAVVRGHSEPATRPKGPGPKRRPPRRR